MFDIETIGLDFETLDRVTQASLTRWIGREAGGNQGKYDALLSDLKEGLGFSPLTGEIAAIGVYDSLKNQGVVYYQAPDLHLPEEKDGNFIFKPETEKTMLVKFWQGVLKYRELVSFNGRGFDAPFLMIRSAVNAVKPSVNLLAKRYWRPHDTGINHIDLLDQFSFYGAMRRRGNLHLYCHAFGIKSPKSGGITGDDISRLYKEKKYREIAEYNSWDLIATAELYEKWQKYLKF